MKHSNISVFIPHKGCPNCCSFCNQRTISGTVNPPSAAEITELLENACLKLRHPENTEIAFFGGSFTGIDRALMVRLLDDAYEYVKSSNDAIDIIINI